MKVDEQLIFLVEQKVTGANIHTVHGIIGLYKNSIHLSKSKNLESSRTIYWGKEAVKYKLKLENFVKTGKIK